MTLTTHVLDIARGEPGAGIAVALYAHLGAAPQFVASAETNADGRTSAPLATDLAAGTYEIVFRVVDYFARSRTPAFYDVISIRITIVDAARSYHVPLLLAPWSYATYRGS